MRQRIKIMALLWFVVICNAPGKCVNSCCEVRQKSLALGVCQLK